MPALFVVQIAGLIMVRARLPMVIKLAASSRTTVKLPKRLDVSKLHSAEFQEALAERMNAVA